MKNFETGETYIGDRLYASFDGWQILLRAPRGMVDHEVFLEPGAWASLVEYVAGLKRQDADSVLIAGDIQAAITAEREACALVCDARANEPLDDEAPLVWMRAAEAIRERSAGMFTGA